MERATWENLDKTAAKIGAALGKVASIERGGNGVRTKLRIDGHQVYGVSGTKNECYKLACVFLDGVEAMMRAGKEVGTRQNA